MIKPWDAGVKVWDKGLEQKPPQTVAADMLVEEKVLAQKAIGWLLALLKRGAAYGRLRGFLKFQGAPLCFFFSGAKLVPEFSERRAQVFCVP